MNKKLYLRRKYYILMVYHLILSTLIRSHLMSPGFMVFQTSNSFVNNSHIQRILFLFIESFVWFFFSFVTCILFCSYTKTKILTKTVPSVGFKLSVFLFCLLIKIDMPLKFWYENILFDLQINTTTTCSNFNTFNQMILI